MKNDLQKYVDRSLSQELNEVVNSYRKNELLDLSNYEKAIIYKYSDDGFEALNEALRENHTMPTLGRHLVHVLNKLPDYRLLCYRAVELSTAKLEKYYEAFEKGIVITERSFLSCSKSKSIALAFCSSPLFIILSRQGKDIEKIAKFGINSGQNEGEILFKPNTKFNVLKITEEKSRIAITLEEV